MVLKQGCYELPCCPSCRHGLMSISRISCRMMFLGFFNTHHHRKCPGLSWNGLSQLALRPAAGLCVIIFDQFIPIVYSMFSNIYYIFKSSKFYILLAALHSLHNPQPSGMDNNNCTKIQWFTVIRLSKLVIILILNTSLSGLICTHVSRFPK